MISGRVTTQRLEDMVYQVNLKENRPPRAWVPQSDGRFKAVEGSLILVRLDGGMCAVAEICNEHGGEQNISGWGRPREIAWWLQGRLMASKKG